MIRNADQGSKSPDGRHGAGGSTATKTSPAEAPPELLRPWKVLLHNDDVNDMQYVVETIVMLTPLNPDEAVVRMFEAHKTGVSLLLTTHRERADRSQLRARSWANYSAVSMPSAMTLIRRLWAHCSESRPDNEAAVT